MGQWNIQNSPCGKGIDLHPGIPHIPIHSQSSPHQIVIHISSIYPLNSYLPPHSTASNSILANSTPVAPSSDLQSTLSPGFTEPTPDGVPVRITSPSWNRGRLIMEPDKGETRSKHENHEGQEHSAETRPRVNSLVLKVFHERMR